jgi:RpiB/LacA/LacB family sugar-phosphate isomerase
LDGDFGKRIEKTVEGAFGSAGANLRFEAARRPEERVVGSRRSTFRIAIGADHRGFELKQGLLRYLRDLGHLVVDCGMREGETVDYPAIALRVSEKVVRKDCDFGIVIDAVGIGSAIAANKIAGIRAAVCYDVEAARSSRLHNDANVLSLGAGFVNRGLARRLVRVWLETPFEGGRHIPRLEKIARLEKDGLDAGL